MDLVEEGRNALGNLVDVLPDAVVVIDAGGLVVHGNVAAERIMGRPLDELMGKSGLDLVHPDDAHFAALSLSSVQGKEVGTPIELRIATVTGWRLVELVGAPADGGLIVLSMRDLTDRRRWEVAGDEVARFRTLLQHTSSITMLLDIDGVVGSVSAPITRQLGQDQEHICGSPLLDIVHPDDRLVVASAIESAKLAGAGSAPVAVEAMLRHFSDAYVPFELSIVSLLDDPTVEGLVVSAHDITRLRAAQDALAALANVDSLTGLPNRRSFDASLEQEWARSNRHGNDSCVLVADLDQFKALNDRYGHAAGDAALRQFAHALRVSVRATDAVARIGGDEFAVILVQSGGSLAPSRFEDVLRARFGELLHHLPMPVDVTIGHASLLAALSPAAALHTADLAMLAKKRQA